jgi:hypothetical protein
MMLLVTIPGACVMNGGFIFESALEDEPLEDTDAVFDVGVFGLSLQKFIFMYNA